MEHVVCPFRDPTSIKEEIRGKDWTRYGGHLHTDQAVRDEFFRVEPEKSKEILKNEWVQDFEYIYDDQTVDHMRFLHGETVSADAVHDAIGKPEDYVQMVAPRRRVPDRRDRQVGLVGDPQAEELNDLLDRCRDWALDADELREL